MKNLLVIGLLLILGCQNQTSNQPISTVSGQQLSDTLVFTYDTFKELSPYFSDNEDQLDSSYYAITYPKFQDSSFNNLLKPTILIDGHQTIEDASQSFIQVYNEFVEEPSTNKLSAWHKEIKSSIQVNSPQIVSVKTQINEYTGGAHGNSIILWSNFDVHKAQKINLNNILQEEKFPIFNQLAEKLFRKQENLSDSSSLSKDFFFDHGIFALNDNFGFTKNHLVFYYNEYEIKPYSEGGTLLEIPYSELTGILTEQGKQYIQSIK